MSASSALIEQLQSRTPNHSLPQAFYDSEAAFAADLERIYEKSWIFMGHSCEFSAPGDYITAQIGRAPVLLVRGEDGLARAFHNSCRHRGSRLCSATKGANVKIVCPYHNWTYDLDGGLRFARDMGDGFDKSRHGLKAIPCQERAGYVFVCLADTPPDFGPFVEAFDRYFGPHDLSHAKVAYESRIIENGNWKLVWENNRECYHCTPNHPELCRTFPAEPAITDVSGGADHPPIAAHWARCESAGLPSRFLIAPDGQFRLARMPLKEGAEAFTMSGKAAVARPLSDQHPRNDLGTLLLYHYPSTWNHVMGDHAISFRVLPIGPNQTELTTKWLVHRDAVEGVDYDLETLTEVWNATNDEDRRIVEENQVGVSSMGYQPGPYSPVHESGVIQFVDWYCRALAG